MALGTTIKTIQDIMRKDTGVDGDAHDLPRQRPQALSPDQAA